MQIVFVHRSAATVPRPAQRRFAFTLPAADCCVIVSLCYQAASSTTGPDHMTQDREGAGPAAASWSVDDVIRFVQEADPQTLGPHVELFRKHVSRGVPVAAAAAAAAAELPGRLAGACDAVWRRWKHEKKTELETELLWGSSCLKPQWGCAARCRHRLGYLQYKVYDSASSGNGVGLDPR